MTGARAAMLVGLTASCLCIPCKSNAQQGFTSTGDGSSAFEKYVSESRARTEGFQKIAEDAEARVMEFGWLDLDYLNALTTSYLVPGFSWRQQTQNRLGDRTTSYLVGNAKLEQYQYVRSLPVSEAISEARKTFEEMYKENPIEARKWARGLNFYASWDSESLVELLKIFAPLALLGFWFSRRQSNRKVAIKPSHQASSSLEGVHPVLATKATSPIGPLTMKRATVAMALLLAFWFIDLQSTVRIKSDLIRWLPIGRDQKVQIILSLCTGAFGNANEACIRQSTRGLD